MYNISMHAETISYTHARQHLAEVMDTCINDSQPILIKRSRKASVVMVPYDDWRSEQETAHILSDPELAAHIRESMTEHDRGESTIMSMSDIRKLLDLDEENV